MVNREKKSRVMKSAVAIEGVQIISSQKHQDERGYFFESYHAQALQKALGLVSPMNFVQDNVSASKQGVLRGLHYQHQHPQAKLVRVLQGQIWDVVVDLRQSSPTFGKWKGYSLCAEKAEQLYVPIGCAHGFITLSESALVMYKVSDYYHPEDEYCLRYDDPTIGVEWPVQDVEKNPDSEQTEAMSVQAAWPILSKKDAQGLSWGQLPLFA